MANRALSPLKQAAYDHCKQLLNERIAKIQAQIKDLESALASETKSSAGDKHETGRAMVQLEREKMGQQWALAEQERERLAKVNMDHGGTLVGPGALVLTEDQGFFIAVSAGELRHGGKTIYCISPLAPLAQALLGKGVGDSVHFNGKTYTITAVH